MSPLLADLEAVYALFLREIKVFFREKERIISIMVSPLLFLFVVGRGLAGHSPVPGYSYQQFIFPGILCMVI
ncbi:MAG: ABC transporter, partial [Elusimicrobia bacterium]|nr:ABC transporter [Elusimicrobiota bacterium]